MNITRTTIASLALLTGAAQADLISIQVENTLGGDNFFFTPVWVAAHNGGFDAFNNGQAASGSTGITQLAENGNTGPISKAFANSGAGGVDATLASVVGDGDAPVYSPGESNTFMLDIGDGSVNRYFSYASMVVPSNDLFFGNDSPNAVELFDAMGNFNGPTVIDIFGRDIYDNGSEVNSATNDAAFSTNDGQSLAEFNTIRSLFSDAGDSDYLASFLGSTTANGATIGSTLGAGDLGARITINQVPAPASVLAFAGAGLMVSRRRRA